MIKQSRAVALTVVACLITAILTFYIATSGLGYNNTASQSTSGGNTFSSSDIALLNEIKTRIKSSYYKDVDDETLITGAAKGMVEALGDDYSEYYTKQEYNDLLDTVSGEYYGIGVIIGIDKDTKNVVIAKVFSDSPAEKAGLKQGDIFLKVNDTDVTGVTTEKLASLVKGEQGTTVTVVIDRDGTEKTITVTRDRIEVDTIASKMLDNKIGYIIISQFGSNTAGEFSSALDALVKDGAKGVVIDLRDNPGGLLDQVKSVADKLLPKGTIVYTLDKSGNKTEYASAASYVDIPIVVLVNGNSASASEILAGAVQDYGRGKIVGTTTFGKGIVQTMLPIITKSGAGLKLTTSTYYTPNGRSIHEKGIEPDVVADLTQDLKDNPAKLTISNDNQLQKAIEVLKTEIK